MAAYMVLVCERCDTSISVRRGDLPERCEACKQPAKWRIALESEYTKSDIRFLKSLRIKWE